MARVTDIYLPAGETEKTVLNCIWQFSEYGLGERKEMILPKGTVEVIFNFSDTIGYENSLHQFFSQLPVVFINGINFNPFVLTKKGNQNFIGLQLSSVGFKQLFGISAKEINNRVYPGEDICPDLKILAEQLYFCQTFCQQADTLLAWIRRKIFNTNKQIRTNRVFELLGTGSFADITVKKLCSKICISDRQFRRFSADWLGMNPEEFIHYNKYLDSLQHIHYSGESLTRIGLSAGYYDQSHFIREFKIYTGLTPSQYRRANKGIPGHIYF
jgi:AraC-like DNA-binding protein